MIQNIPVKWLYSHPDNPRKDLGDLTELAESIKANGVLQNLTVVPHPDEVAGPTGNEAYRVVIGHRRLAAAKLAGLEELPCAISDMDRRDQIATMLLENMQRSDLTVYEQAQGIQMMMNLGESVTSISEKTGFSESTVRRRVKLLELDGDLFKKATQRGATLMDFAELEEIKSIERRNEVLKELGTNNFKYKLRNALDEEKAEANRVLWAEALSMFASEVESESGYRRVKYYSSSDNPDKLEVPEDTDTLQYFYCITRWSVLLLKEDVSTEAEQKIEDERKRRAECSAAIDEIDRRTYQLREDFILNCMPSKKRLPDIIKFYAKTALSGTYANFDGAVFARAMGLMNEAGEYEDLTFEDIEDHFKSSPERVFLVMAYCDFDDGPRLSYSRCRWNEWPHYVENERLDALYEMLEALGYQMSDEERALKDGTHELLHKGDQPHD